MRNITNNKLITMNIQRINDNGQMGRIRKNTH